MRYIVTINNKNYEVEVEKGEASIIRTEETAARIIPAVTQAPAAAVPSSPAPSSPASSSPAAPVTAPAAGNPVTAPMPGTILNIKMSNGQKVKRGEVIFILEAMKMENEITAPVDGVVAQIIAAKGSSVSTGDVLAVIQ